MDKIKILAPLVALGGLGVVLYFANKAKASSLPGAPTNFLATPFNNTQIDLSWTKDIGANRTLVVRKLGNFPTDYSDGILVYFNTGTTISDTGLSPNIMYYYRAWSEVTIGSIQYFSASYASISASTTIVPELLGQILAAVDLAKLDSYYNHIGELLEAGTITGIEYDELYTAYVERFYQLTGEF
jgi:hypothetical protein